MTDSIERRKVAPATGKVVRTIGALAAVVGFGAAIWGTGEAVASGLFPPKEASFPQEGWHESQSFLEAVRENEQRAVRGIRRIEYGVPVGLAGLAGACLDAAAFRVWRRGDEDIVVPPPVINVAETS